MSAESVPLCRLLVDPGSPTSRTGEPVTLATPFARGAVRDVAVLGVTDAEGRARPVASQVTGRWSDGSVRWALLDTVLDVPPTGTAVTVHARGGVSHHDPLSVVVTPDRITVQCRKYRTVLDAAAPAWLAEAVVHGQTALDPARTRFAITDGEDRHMRIRHGALELEHSSPLRVVVCTEGVAIGAGGVRLNLTWRWTFVAGVAAVWVEFDVHNSRAAAHPGGVWELGDSGSVFVKGIAMELAPPAGGTPLAVEAALQTGDTIRPYDLPFGVHQHSSGGPNWASSLHVNRAGAVPHRIRGYDGQEGHRRFEGLRAHPVIRLRHPGGTLTVTSSRFWEVFPKAYDVSPDGLLCVWSLPPGPDTHEIQGGERFSHGFSVGFCADTIAESPLEWRRAPSMAFPDPKSAAAAELVAGLTGDAPADEPYRRLVASAVEGPDTFAIKRDRIDEYGWRHFGELYADHENAHGGADIVSHYNNQYDAVFGLFAQTFRTGDFRWGRLAHDLARHVARIDVYWTTLDRAAYSGGLFWHTAHYVDAGRSTHRSYPRAEGVHGGGPSVEHCYSSGLMFHYYLTGDCISRDVVLSLAQWVIAMDDGALARWPLPWLSSAATGQASSTREGSYHGPGRGPANAVHALLNAHQLTSDDVYLAKADALVTRVIHPTDDIESRELLDPERRWSYTVFLQALGRYLSVRAELGKRDTLWEYARASLLHYARWMAAHERPYLDHPEQLEYPTETWAAQDMRKSEVFDLAAMYAESADERQWFVDRARFFHRTSVATLASMPTRSLTRPVVLLLSNGFAREWFERHTSSAPLGPASRGPWPPRRTFVSQRAIAERRVEVVGGVGAAVAGAVVLWALAVLGF